jgi:23S rRNA (adenine-N6)-dimethyltransferase
MPARKPSRPQYRNAPKRSPGRPRDSRPNHSGIHLLKAPRLVRGIVAAAGTGPGTLVLDLGAGPGTLTGPLAESGARVLAIERDPRFVRRLHKRFGDRPNVRVVEADLRDVPLPRRPYQVVASLPFDLSTHLFRRLFDSERSSVYAADLIVEWGFAKRMTAAVPRDLEVAWWASRYEFRLVRRLPARLFTPEPAVDCAQLRVRPRPGLSSPRRQRSLRRLLTAAYRGRGPMVAVDQWAELVQEP